LQYESHAVAVMAMRCLVLVPPTIFSVAAIFFVVTPPGPLDYSYLFLQVDNVTDADDGPLPLRRARPDNRSLPFLEA